MCFMDTGAGFDSGFACVGAYSDSRGLPGVRQEVADFILERDGDPR
jgi:aspartate/methionine/tyrosine aminotransferase